MMNADPSLVPTPEPSAALRAAIRQATGRIAPSWPLDRFIAVNPLWGFVDRPLPEVAARVSTLTGASLLMPRAWYRDAWRAGRFTRAHLDRARVEHGSLLSTRQLLERLERDPAPTPRWALMTDVFDAQRDLGREMAWSEFVVHQLSQVCAAYFDRHQAQLAPDADPGLYRVWRRQAVSDRAPALLMGSPQVAERLRQLPDRAEAVLVRAVEALAVEPTALEGYLTALLLDVGGWASWCAYLRWNERLQGRDDDHLVELLAARLAWEWVLLESGGRPAHARWQFAQSSWRPVSASAVSAREEDWVYQRATEIAYQDRLESQLPRVTGRERHPTPPALQAVFCIDVRSEVLRRALEAQEPGITTMGFAGFFGLAADYWPAGSPEPRPHRPGLLGAKLRIEEAPGATASSEGRQRRAGWLRSWQAFKRGPTSTFSFAEAVGPLHALELLRATTHAWWRSDRPTPAASGEPSPRPRLVSEADGRELSLAQRAALAGSLLRGMGLQAPFARLVVLVGHGAEAHNNPQAAGLQCGACGGQSGEVSARAAAGLLNEPEVRAELARAGVDVPETTHFLPALHVTTSDHVRFFDAELVPASHAEDLARARVWFDQAGRESRRERAPALGLEGLDDPRLERAVRARESDWSEVRPEWGLANNAAFIAAPRQRIRGMNLEGRVFLHEYDSALDPDHALLEQIMTAPMVVAHWINLQYYASTVDNERFGSGNKLIHNVVGENIGVFEGNGGDLRTGLALQSLHDGQRWRHEPLRLSVYLAAPCEAIDQVLARHETLRALVTGGWLHLHQLDLDRRQVRTRLSEDWGPARAGRSRGASERRPRAPDEVEDVRRQ